ncbi:MAG: iron-sulfur cluster repair protein YtfE [Rhodospirillales bacterium]|nr:iron-sulfur cluster repair protein YtfE [Rhodospirillales bacterium]
MSEAAILNEVPAQDKAPPAAQPVRDRLLAGCSLVARPVGELAAALPGATAVFRRHKLDFCCGGAATLAEAAAGRGLDPAAIAAELAALDPALPDATPSTAEGLIDLILARYHAVHRRDLPELVKLARRVEAVHRGKPGTPEGLAAVLERMQAELESHMAKEEAILFPLLRAGPDSPMASMAAAPIARMRFEHDEHGAELRQIAVLTGELTLPEGACGTFRALYANLARFQDDLTTHIHLENNVLFPLFAIGDMPDGSCRAMTAGH